MQLARIVCALALVSSAAAYAAPSKITFERACKGPGRRCHARVAMRDGHPASVPIGNNIAAHSASQIESIYHLDITRGAGMTVAVIDAYGYPELESDLAEYRHEFQLPECSKANGCLRVVNVEGTTALPPASNSQDAQGWELETALDVDMISAGCPLCKILVVEAHDPGDELDQANATAAKLGANVISNSWGSPEGGDLPYETYFTQLGVGIFVSSGDDGYPAGAQYPATSPNVIAVGGTSLRDDILAGTATESAWSDAGSSCSGEFAAPPFQPSGAACPNRAASDVAAVADPETGVALYCSAAGGLTSAGGTSASSPLVAAIFAASGHPDANAAFVYRHPEAFVDVTFGSNGDCGTTMCDAGSGWDGPTGLGSPDQRVLLTIGSGAGPTVSITSPADGSTQTAAFSVVADVGAGAAHVDLAIDGVRVIGLAAAPYTFDAQALAPGTHTVTVSAYDTDHDTGSAQISIVVPALPPDAGVNSDAGLEPITGGGGGQGGCGATGHGGGALVVLGAVLLARRNRRRAPSLQLR